MAEVDQDDVADLEDMLDNFFIRKPVQSTKSNSRKNVHKGGQKIHRGIPLTMADIRRSRQNPDQPNVYITGNWHFETCILYGFVAGRCVHNKAYHKYIVDDGTASMEVSIFSNIAKQKQIASLYSEATVLAGVSRTEADKKLSGCMTNLLLKAKEYIDASVISPGMNIMLDGRPSIFKGKVRFDAFSFCLDNERTRKMEIAFADHLIDWYNNR